MNLRLKILRLTKDKKSRQKIGRLMLFSGWDCLFWCHILEPFNNFPAGSYTVKKYESPTFKRTVLLYDITDANGNNRFIEIHPGNYLKDTKGCQLPGDAITDMNADGLYDVKNSKPTMDKLLSFLPDGVIKIDVYEDPKDS